MKPFHPEVVEVQNGLNRVMSMAIEAMEFNPKPRVRWAWIAERNCWRFVAENMSGLSDGIRTREEEAVFYQGAYRRRWMQ